MHDSLLRYEPTQPLPLLVAELNNLYHEREAEVYERTHPEIFQQLPPLWREMVCQFRAFVKDSGKPFRKLRILDFGCGTGFAARQCLEWLGEDQIEGITCYDPSTRMIERCRKTLHARSVKAEYCSDRVDLEKALPFDLLVTNSVLHHMVDPDRCIRDLLPLLSPDAVWLCGHEPSSRFIANSECRALLSRYRTAHALRRLLSPDRYLSRFLRVIGRKELPEDFAARRSFERAMFRRRPSSRVIGNLVDFHVVHNEQDLQNERGLDYTNLEAAWAGSWRLMWRKSYSFLGPFYEARLPTRWRDKARNLALRYPNDGANVCLVWARSEHGV